MGHCVSNSNFKCSQCGLILMGKGQASRNLSLCNHQCLKNTPIIRKKTEKKISSNKLNQIKKLAKIDENNKIKVKVPCDNSNTIFRWIDEPAMKYSSQISKLSAQQIRNGSFQQKLAWFRAQLDPLNAKWKEKSELIKVDRQKIIQSSFEALNNIDLLSELKVEFMNDKAEDAGAGLLRQWMHLCIKQIMSDEVGIFKQANTSQSAYKLVWSNNVSDETSFKSLHLLGLLIGKAILQKLSLDCPLDYTIVRQICCQPLQLQDVYSYDRAFYQSWKNMLQMSNVQELCMDGTIYYQHIDGTTEQIEVFPNGKNVQITEANKQMYISQLINLYCAKSVQSEIDELRKAIYSVIPAQLLSIFEPYQFQMLLNGPSFIDIQDLKHNTVYDNYQSSSQVIQWFWEVVESYRQEGYKNLLHYVTGSARVPVLGFSKLQSSRGHIKKFTIRKIELDNLNPHPKSYTCFNRLDLPQYLNKEQLKQKLAFILDEQFSYFGLC